MGLHGMVANALAAAGVGQLHTRRMEETVLDMPVEEELVVSGDDVRINILMRFYVPTMSSSWCAPTT